jgi:hypothetical protein
MTQHTSDVLAFSAVIMARFLIPLGIPRFPLPFEVAAALLDAADQTIFQAFTHLDLTGYQGYDKALDVYYLTIIYLATMRNWTNLFAFEVSRFLYFYRLLGIVLFEAFLTRALLLVFANTFEYFFIFYEAVRLRWNPKRMSKRLVIGATAFIWIFIKLPQEYWIHVAQLDSTEVTNEHASGNYSFAFVGLAVLIVILIWGAKWFLDHNLPPADWKFSFDADAHDRDVTDDQVTYVARVIAQRLFDRELIEKLVMISMVVYIFSRIIPSLELTKPRLAIGIVVFIFINSALSEWLVRRGIPIRSIAIQFFATAAINSTLIVAFDLFLRWGKGEFQLRDTLFFGLLLSLLVVLYDRYRPIHLARVAAAG